MKSYYLFCLIITLLCSLSIKAQSHQVFASPEELKKVIVETRYHQPEQAFQYAKSYLQYGRSHKDSIIICQAYNQLGVIESIRGNSQNALEYYDKGIELALQIDYWLYQSELFLRKGNLLYKTNHYREALQLYEQSLEIAEQHKLHKHVAVASTSIAYLQTESGNYKVALHVLKNSLHSVEDLDFSNEVIKASNLTDIHREIGEIHLTLNQTDSAFLYFEKGLSSCAKNDRNMRSILLKDIGKVHYQREEIDSALSYFLTSKELSLSLQNTSLWIENLYYQSLISYERKAPSRSLELLTPTLDSIASIDRFPKKLKGKIYGLLGNAYLQVDSSAKASYFLQQQLTLEQQINQHQQAIIAALYQKDLLHLQSQITQLSKNNYWGYTTFLIVLGGLSIAWVCIIRKRRKRQKQFENLNKDPELKATVVKEVAPPPKPPEQRFVINEEKAEEIRRGLHKLQEEGFFLKKECSLYQAAKKIKTNTSYLSKVINEKEQKSFSAFVNDYRMKYVIEQLQNDSTLRSYSVKAIAEEIGFKSADAFSKCFRSHTGQNPSQFIKQLELLKENEQNPNKQQVET